MLMPLFSDDLWLKFSNVHGTSSRDDDDDYHHPPHHDPFPPLLFLS